MNRIVEIEALNIVLVGVNPENIIIVLEGIASYCPVWSLGIISLGKAFVRCLALLHDCRQEILSAWVIPKEQTARTSKITLKIKMIINKKSSKPNLHDFGFQSFVLESASILTKKVVLGWLLPSNKCGTCGASAMTWSKCWRAETQLPALEDSLGTSGELFVHWL